MCDKEAKDSSQLPFNALSFLTEPTVFFVDHGIAMDSLLELMDHNPSSLGNVMDAMKESIDEQENDAY